ncbi:MAG: hypothetical protein H7Y31_05760, partial [Chitinophagaceae bacterium]|nr:hypothetical protein [Chitinophagaceae bacterium]
CVVASPIAYFLVTDWLAKYDYKVTIGLPVFIGASVIAIVITVLTISFQAIKAATANPVTSLRSE